MIKYFSLSAFNTQSLRILLNYGVPLVPHKIQGAIVSLFTLFFINQKMGLIAAGLYAVAQKFSKPISFVVASVQKAWAPYKFQIHKEEKAPAALFKQIISSYWILLISIWTVLAYAMPWLIKTLVDERYWNGIPYVPFIMFIYLCQAWYFTVSTGFELTTKQQIASWGSFLGLLIIVGGSLLFQDFYAPYPFFIAQGAAYFVMGIILYREAQKIIKIDYPFIAMAIYLIINVSMVSFYYSMPSTLNQIIGLLLIGISSLILIHYLYSFKHLGNYLNLAYNKIIDRK